MEELNQVQTNEEVESDFSFDEEDFTDETDTTEEVETDTPFLNVKFNKEDKGLSKEEAINFAQKGMNYDKINDRLNVLTTKLGNLAKANGQDVDAYLNALEQMQTNLVLDKEMESLKEEHPDADEALLKEIAQSRVNARVKEAVSQVEETNSNIAMQVDEFNKLFPDVDARELDNEVYALMDEGKSLTEAYLLVEHQKNSKVAKAKEKVSSQNEANKKKSVGNISNVHDDGDFEFDFLH